MGRPGPRRWAAQDWRSHFGGPAWTLDEASGQYWCHLFLPEQTDLNWRNPAVREEEEEPIAGAIAVRPDDGLVIVEGNYLLLKEPPWDRIRPALDLCAYLELDDATRVRRLLERHMRYGKSRSEAERFVRHSDEKNARLTKTTRHRADLIVRPG